jgi:MFS family permease
MEFSAQQNTASTTDPDGEHANLNGWADLLAEGRLPRFALISLGVWMNAADSLITATIMPSVGVDLGGYAYFSWAVAGFLLGGIMAGASSGRVSEVLGLRSAMTIAGLVFMTGCLLSAVAPNIGLFLTGRLVQGAGSGWISGFSMVAIALLFPERHLARVFASVAAIWGIATVLGPMVGGLFAQAGNWRAVFWLFAFQALAFSAAAPQLLKGAHLSRRGAGIPWLQLGVLGAGMGAIALADISRQPLVTFGLVAMGLGSLGLVLRLDVRAPVRLLPHRASDLQTIPGAGYAAVFATTAASVGFSIYGPAILQKLQNLSPLQAGYVVGAEACAWTLAAFVVTSATGSAQRSWIRRGAACILLGVALLTVVMHDAVPVWVVVAAAVMGAGFGFSSSLTNHLVMAALSDEDRAIGSSALIAVRQTGGAIGAAIAGATANLVGFGEGITMETAQATAVWVFVTALPMAAAGAWASWRLTDIAKQSPDG